MLKNSRGVTLTELMIAVAVLSVAVLGLVGSFGGLQKAIQLSKNTTLASNLAQEQMQILKQKSYFQVLVTTAPNATPDLLNVPHDDAYFPPETILEGGVSYTRLTYVQVAQEVGGVIQTLSPSTPDTGLRLLTVTVIWQMGGDKKKLQVLSLLSNPDTVMADAIFTGHVYDGGVPVQNALVNVAENQGFRAITDASGAYTITLSPGSYTLGVTVPGYYPAHASESVAANATVTQDFDLQAISSGSAIGTAWVNPNVVISQIMISTQQADTGFQAQYIELYNPTPNTVTVYDGSAPQLKLDITSGCSGAGNIDCPGGIGLNYVNTQIAPGGYYVIANTGTFTVEGKTVTADAVYRDDAVSACTYGASFTSTYWDPTASPPLKLVAPYGHSATLYLTNAAGTIQDAVGWTHGGITSNHCETDCIDEPSGGPLSEQFVRITSPTWTNADMSLYGRAYDSDDNTVDITSTTGGPIYEAMSTADGSRTVVSGKPAVGAVVTANDGLSISTRAYATGSPPTAAFALTQIETGTWTVLVSSDGYALENDTVTIAATGSVYVFPATMSWLTTLSTDAFISGTVTDVLGVPLNPQVPVDPGGLGQVGYASTTNGRYILRVTTSGFVNVVANSGSGSLPNYVSMSSASVAVTAGQVTSGVDFLLSQGGQVSGYATRDGVNPLPGVAFTILDSNGYSHDQQVSGTNGYFASQNISTGTYEVEPVLDSLETASPSSTTVTVSAGLVAWSSTFTITGALGTISGSVTTGGGTLSTGVLIVVTTKTFSGSPPVPPTLDESYLSDAPVYTASSREDGTYSVSVRESTSPAYNVYAYYVTYSGTTPSISSKLQSGVQVLSGASVTGVDFAW
jgi:prepilin-type N-terminal cleavage/methylation domain-containing protein